MDLNGEEKRIQALFHELKAQDEESAPPFARAWNMVVAEFDRSVHPPVLLKSLVVFPRWLMAIFIVGFLITTLVVWSQPVPPRQAQDHLASQASKNSVPVFEAGVKRASETDAPRRPKSQKRNVSIPAVRQFMGKRLMARPGHRQVRPMELSRWQSPTVGLLRFPGDELLKNSPGLNQSTHEMRGFLSNLN